MSDLPGSTEGGVVLSQTVEVPYVALRHRLYRAFWKQTKDCNLNTVEGCEEAAQIATDTIFGLLEETDSIGVTLP